MNSIEEKSRRKGEILLSIVIAIGFSLIITTCIFTALFTKIEEFVSMLNQAPIRVGAIYIIIALVLVQSYIIVQDGHLTRMTRIRAQCLVSFAILLTTALSLVTDLFFGPFARPIALAGIFIAVLINKRSAFFCEVVIAILFIIAEGFLYGFPANRIVFTMSGMFVGILMVLFVTKDDTRLRTMLTTVIMVPIAIAVSSAFYLVFFNFSWSEYKLLLIQSAISPIISGVVYLAILPLFEAIFKVITSYYLAELSDVNKSLLGELARKAPGTFNHSFAVSNLAAACALNIGENPRLARCCGLYHDIGKLSDPSVFTENQLSEEENPHNRLTPELSVNLIKRHVSYGKDLLTAQRYPEEIIKAAIEHHGTMPITYFYTKAKKFTDGYVNVRDYSYDGPLPSSKITAILMIVDASEAAVRALTNRSREKIDEIIKNIIEERMELEQFDACGITFKDLQIIRTTLVDNFAGVYHDRIEYPKLKIVKKANEE